ncbi:hypothetical protein P171DRAFT_367798, partial [Karstenula rhodostoma CBS 690.94]
IAWAAIVQPIIYDVGPCNSYALLCDASEDGTIPKCVYVMLQLPAYFLFALSEALFAIAASEYAYTEAPKCMKPLVAELNLFMVAIAYVLGIPVSRAALNPHLTISTYFIAFHHFPD